MSDTPRTDGQEFTPVQELGHFPPYPTVSSAFARELERENTKLLALSCELAVEKGQLEREIKGLKQVMLAAYDEILEHWNAHCDTEGYGPANLMRRLKEGIPTNYNK